MGTPANVVVGVGKIYVAPVDATLATLPTIGDGTGGTTLGAITFGSPWQEVGYTKDGVEFGYASEIFEGKVDQEMSPVVRLLMGEKVTIKTKLAETTIFNINRVISASTLSEPVVQSSTAVNILTFGSGSLTELMVAFCGKGPSGVERVFILYRATSDAPVTLSHKANDLTVLDVTWTGLDTDEDGVGCILQPTA